MKVSIGPYPEKFKAKRKINIMIHDYDIWNVDSTLAYIITPLLVKLKESKGGVPRVYDEDLPKEIIEKYPDSYELMDGLEFRWNYILDSMIFSFETYNTNWEEQFYPNGLMYDKEAYDIFEKKLYYGIRMFGKYFGNLWT